jgi:cellulose synthase (UDP-forming)
MSMRKLSSFILWAAVSLVVMALITLPISLQTHLIAGTAVVVAMMMLKAVRPHGIWRLIALALGTSIVLRYVYWRSTSTLPPINQPQDFIPGLLVYLSEMYSVGMLALSLFVVANSQRSTYSSQATTRIAIFSRGPSQRRRRSITPPTK